MDPGWPERGDDLDAIFCDLGDTLVRIRPEWFFESLGRLVPDLDVEAFYRQVLAEDVYRDFATGRIDGPAFAASVGRILGARWSYEEFKDVWVDMMDPIPGTEQSFRLALRHVPVYILSNTDPVHASHIRGRFPWIEEATGFFLSYDVGLLKPDPRFYTLALERYGFEAGRVLFVDDRKDNVEAARVVGLVAVHAGDPGVFSRLVTRIWGPPT